MFYEPLGATWHPLDSPPLIFLTSQYFRQILGYAAQGFPQQTAKPNYTDCIALHTRQKDWLACSTVQISLGEFQPGHSGWLLFLDVRLK